MSSYTLMLKKQLDLLLDSVNSARSMQPGSRKGYVIYLRHVNFLVDKYNRLLSRLNVLLDDEGIDSQFIVQVEHLKYSEYEVTDAGEVYDSESTLVDLAINLATLRGLFEDEVVLSEQSQNRLDAIRSEIALLASDGVPDSVSTNLEIALTCFEKGLSLGTALICGRLVRYQLDKLPNGDINEKIEILRNAGLLPEKSGKDSLVKSIHMARNVTSHDPSVVPELYEAMSLLGDTISLIKICDRYRKMIDIESE